MDNNEFIRLVCNIEFANNKDFQVWKETWNRGGYCGYVLWETNCMVGVFVLVTTCMCNLKYWIDTGN